MNRVDGAASAWLVFAAGIFIGMAFAPGVAIVIGLGAAVAAGAYVWRGARGPAGRVDRGGDPKPWRERPPADPR